MKVKATKVMITKIVLDQAGSFINSNGQTINYVSRKVFGLDMSNAEAFREIVFKYPEHLSSVISSLVLGDILDFEAELILSQDGTSASFLISNIFKNGHSLLPGLDPEEKAGGKK